jgi:hypothetical protein
VLPIYSGHLMGHLTAFFLGEDFIPYVYETKYLRVIFNYHLCWDDHASTSCLWYIGHSLDSGDSSFVICAFFLKIEYYPLKALEKSL